MFSEFVNIIGYGYVGSALGYVCSKNKVGFCTFDVIKKNDTSAFKNFDNLQEMVNNSEKYNTQNAYFICVPTPPKESGECDTTIVENVILKLFAVTTLDTTIFIKSTVEPGTCRELNKKYGNSTFRIVFCPEFLKERSYKEDMYNADFAILGFSNENLDYQFEVEIMKTIYNHKKLDVIIRSYEEAELFKYTINVFLAVKVWYFNEINILSDKFGVDYNKFKTLFKLEPRLGSSHLDVPGPDGNRGFGGKCLPKETKGMCYLQDKKGINNEILQKILDRNISIRGEEP